MPELLARLDKSGLRILCANTSCGTEIACIRPGRDTATVDPESGTIIIDWEPDDPNAEMWLAGDDVLPGPGDRRDVAFPMGWRKGPDGVWAMTPRARERWRKGKPPAFRRDPLALPWDHDQPRARYRVVLHRPIRARCPKCGLVQTLDAHALRLSPWPSYPPILPGQREPRSA